MNPTGTAGQPRSSRWLAYVSGAFGLAASAQINFLVPLRARELGASFDIIGLIVGAGAVAPALLSISLGALIDRIGPRRGFILGAASSAVLCLPFLLVTDYWWLLALQPILGVARNLAWVASQSYITSISTAAERTTATGRFSFFSNGGQMAGPVLTGAMAQIVGFRWAFCFLVVYATIFTVIGLLLPQTDADSQGQERVKQGTGLRSALGLLPIRGIQVVLVLTFARLWTTWVYTTFYSVYLVDSGLEPGLAGTVMATSGLVATLLAPSAGFWVGFLPAQTVVALGLGCGATALLLAPHVSTLPFVYLVPMLVGIGTGLSLPLLINIISAAAPPEKRGVALGLRGMINQTAATAAPLVVGPSIAALGIMLGFTTGGLVTAAMLVAAQLLSVGMKDSPGAEEEQRG